jgi:hypothetical protein
LCRRARFFRIHLEPLADSGQRPQGGSKVIRIETPDKFVALGLLSCRRRLEGSAAATKRNPLRTMAHSAQRAI